MTELTEHHYFEVMDRCHILMMNIDSSLEGHPALTKKMRKKIEKAQVKIMDVYQWAGAKCDGEKP